VITFVVMMPILTVYQIQPSKNLSWVPCYTSSFECARFLVHTSLSFAHLVLIHVARRFLLTTRTQRMPQWLLRSSVCLLPSRQAVRNTKAQSFSTQVRAKLREFAMELILSEQVGLAFLASTRSYSPERPSRKSSAISTTSSDSTLGNTAACRVYIFPVTDRMYLAPLAGRRPFRKDSRLQRSSRRSQSRWGRIRL
jgi:hypothetical protein